VAKTPKLLRNGRQIAYIVLRDEEFHRAYPMRILAEGYRRSVSHGSKCQWKLVKGTLTFAAAAYRVHR